MRGKKVIFNTIIRIIEECVAIISSFILPRLILSQFGSKYNGLITSITQFLACAVLLRSGIGGATRAALYKPLAEKDTAKVSSIVNATDRFMKKVGLVLAGAIIIFASVYPLLVQREFQWFFTFTLFLIIGVSTFAESFFGITYLIVLQADQKIWISSIVKIACTVLNTIVAVVLIRYGCSIHCVKLVSTIAFSLYPIILSKYVRKKYMLDKRAIPDRNAISQRWDAFWQQAAIFVMNNTDVMVLTAFSTMTEVSVYSVYHMVIAGLRRFISTFTESFEGAFGNMIAKKETALLKSNFSLTEMVTFDCSTIAFTSAGILILDFVKVYTRNVFDTNYIRPVFAVLMLFSQYINCIRLPYQLIVDAAGHYRQTRNGAIVEPILNIGLSLMLVSNYGVLGVTVGTLVAALFRTVQYVVYMCKNIINRSPYITVFRCLLSMGECCAIVLLAGCFDFGLVTNYISWVKKAIEVTTLSSVVVFLFSILFFRKDVLTLAAKIKTCVLKTKS